MRPETDGVRAFKGAVNRRALRAGVLFFLISIAFRDELITLGFVFGMCVGFVNTDLMFRNTSRVLSSGTGSGWQSGIFYLIRYALFALAGFGAWWKGFNLIAVVAGFLVPMLSLISFGFTESLKKRYSLVEKGD